jgi:hypothetical protein
MLTKEEASNFTFLINEADHGHSGLYYEIDVSEFKDILNKFTEKPKREIQVGDIYLDNHDRLHRVSWVTAYFFICGEATKFNFDGTGHGHADCELNISKPYRLFPMEEIK